MNILITGSTDGIGKLVGIKLAEQGHEVYLHGRNREKLATVVSEIKEGRWWVRNALNRNLKRAKSQIVQ